MAEEGSDIQAEFGNPQSGGIKPSVTRVIKQGERAPMELGLTEEAPRREPLFNSTKLYDNPEEQRERPQRHYLPGGIAILSAPYGSEASGVVGVTNEADLFTFHGKPKSTYPYHRDKQYLHWETTWKDEKGDRKFGWISTPIKQGTRIGEHKGSPIFNFYPMDALKEEQFK